MNNRMAVTKINHNGRDYTALIVLDEHRKFTELSIFEPEEERLLDRTVIARVERVLPGLNSAFVRISPTQKAYLPLEHLDCAIFTKKQSQKKNISEGDELLVQVVKEAQKTKDPVVDSKITLVGKYCLLFTSGCNKFSISGKIKGEKRKELLQFSYGLTCDIPESNNSYEILLRTNCQQAGIDELREDITSLIQKWERISQQAMYQNAYSIMDTPLSGYVRQMQSISYDEIDYVYTDDNEIYEAISASLPYLIRENKLVLYRDKSVPLSVLYNIEGNIDSLTSQRVWLPSGGNLIIEQVETMTVIDVNSAKSSVNRSTMLKTNLEAAVEIPRQLKLRNISGMIIVDFINMDNAPDDEAQFINVLKKELRKDQVPASFVDITKLGLVEITRKKTRKSLKETLAQR